MNLITLDFETYFDKDYTLSKLTTEEYIRNPRFKAHCVALKGFFTDGSILTVSKSEEIPPTLEKMGIIAHHAQFDGLILSHHYNIRPAMWFDTLSMARLVFPHAKSHSLGNLAKMLGLQEKTVPYESFKGIRDLPPDLYNRVAEGCANDVELTYAVFKMLLPYVPMEELRVIDLTIRMFTEPALTLDRDRLQDYLQKTQAQKEETLRALAVSKADLQSSAKFGAILESLGVQCPTKTSPKGRQIFAFAKTDDGMKELLAHDNETVAALAAARLSQKSTLGETRALRLLGMHERGPLSVYLNYCGAHTTRWSGGDSLNWQNFTRGSEIRKSIKAPPGYKLVIIDLAQIEARMLNWLAGEEEILNAFREGRDLYAEGATRFYGRQITRDDKAERHLGKTLELGCGYGMGWSKFQYTCRGGALGGPPIILTEEESRRAVESYRQYHPNVVKLWKYADAVLDLIDQGGEDFQWGPMRVVDKCVRLPNGAYLNYSNLTVIDGDYHTVSRRGVSKIYGAKVVENVVQGLARVVLSQAMLKIAIKYKILMTSHDEAVFLVRAEEAPQALLEGLQIMKTPPAWCRDLPLDAEGIYDERYSK